MKRIIGALLLVIFLTPSSAYAHTALVSSSPKNGAVLTKSPSTISLTFTEELLRLSGKNVSRLSLIDSAKKQIALGKTTFNKATFSAKLKTTLIPGRYTVNYRVVSSDGHPVTGSIKFRIK